MFINQFVSLGHAGTKNNPKEIRVHNAEGLKGEPGGAQRDTGRRPAVGAHRRQGLNRDGLAEVSKLRGAGRGEVRLVKRGLCEVQG